METSQLKNYGPQARRDFIEGVKNQAAVYGLLPDEIVPMKEDGDVVIIGDRPFPRAVTKQRIKLEECIRQEGFDHVIEAIAYTWFNRFVAIRFMELHGYLDHSYRVLSHPDGKSTPEILEIAERVELPGLDRDKVVELKLDGTKDEELYRLLLLAQCNALNKAMPFLFERIGDETELLLPANLLHTDSLIRQLVEQIEEAAWQDIEIIGWLYQFYISDKKKDVIGKVVKSQDIPAATQLFTPNWIVKYMVQNSLGAQWLATYPQSPLKGQMEYYIEPAEQTDEVNAQLAAITPSQLNPEKLTLIDPASGSGHILVEAYELFKAIYLERGYRQRDVPQLILEKNLFGLDIDERAAQLTGFALMMKGRADDRRLFGRGVKLNVMALVDSAGFDPESLANGMELSDYLLKPTDLTELKRLFKHATTFGSLIQVPEVLAEKLPALKQLIEATSQELFVSEALRRLEPLVQQAELLATQYDAVVANPPYMGSGGMTGLLKKFAKDNFPESKSDLFACFIERGLTLAKTAGHSAMITMQSWMFLWSFEKMRERILRDKTICAMAHLGARAFGSISGEVVQTTACVLSNRSPQCYKPVFFRLLNGGEGEKRIALANGENRFDATAQDAFRSIPGSPIAYWPSRALRAAFRKHKSLAEVARPREGLNTTDNDRFLRRWWECRLSATKLDTHSADDVVSSGATWFPCQKGGTYRKWFGNNEYVVNWWGNGADIKSVVVERYGSATKRVVNEHLYFQEGITWSSISSSALAMRHVPAGYVFETKGNMCFFETEPQLLQGLGFCNSCVVNPLIQCVSPTLDFHAGPVGKLPVAAETGAIDITKRSVHVARADWNSYERSWDFQSLPLLAESSATTLESSYTAWTRENHDTIAEMKRLEEENNRLFIDAYGLADELSPDVPIEQITLTVNPAYRYGLKVGGGQWAVGSNGAKVGSDGWSIDDGFGNELEARFRQDTMEELVSYAIGCMMGRYSLDHPGLIYAHSGNEGFDPGRYTSFPADDDGIVPLTDTEWFDDDAAHRLIEFISVAWDKNHLEANLTFLAENLSPKKNESSRETIRRYLCDKFFKDHLQTYKKRPIYWLFSSGKQKAFQCLVYLHRYNEGTLARMRTKYVVPLQGKINARVEQLESDIPAATSTSHRKTLERERDKLVKQRNELQTLDEKLRHYADQRIHLDLDDGVKVNYSKFGDLLAEVKAITGKKPKVEVTT
ncbi:Eco57I restriction-modification methylase [Stieleria neptunia]|uniref:site-specific DNA-methyltransferase (adenine-specific) n=1 Tax=Stieleria neptunia TaxID=2527979 RepID=A0A518HSV7_9BACT|nr:BREX-1 system adenine-specific DNA-methyltransferase PglX [Stieleria neptunia]QDV43922.1 Eco57I restriction-modification methylase [Stieleria neptunia]